MFQVHVYALAKASRTTYDGTGSRSSFRTFDDLPSANRFAQEAVELHGAEFASVTRLNEKETSE